MKKYITLLPLCAAMALTMPVSGYAQTAATETPAATDAPETAEPTAEATPATEENTTTGSSTDVQSQLSLGEDADGEPTLGKPYTKEVIGAWEMRCIKTEEDVDPCQMYQLMDDGQGAPVAEFSLFRDGGKARRYPFAFCNPVGCYVRMGLTEADVAAFKRGKEAVITIVPALAPDQKVELSLSLDGFTASFDKSSVVEDR